jgi:hypothetical protein
MDNNLYILKLERIASVSNTIDRAMRQLEAMQVDEEAKTGRRDEDVHLIQNDLLVVLERLAVLESAVEPLARAARASARRSG